MNKNILTRVRMMYVLLLLAGIAVIGQIVYLQYFTSYGKQAKEIAHLLEEVEANRGNILARDGRPLASSVPYYQIRIDCMTSAQDTFQRYVGPLAESLSRFFGDRSAAQYKNELLTARQAGNRYKALGNRDVSYSELAEIKKFPLFHLGANLGGIIAIQKNKRKNPYGRLGFRTIGFINQDGVGAGVESAYDFYLKGLAGEQTVQRLPGGELMPLSNIPSIRPLDGYDVQTTIDIDIQEATETALRNQLAKSTVFEAATAVVMEVQTGAIRAISNMKRTGENQYDESYNYAIGAATEPGSTFKLASLIALIEGGYLGLNSQVHTGNGHWTYAGKTFSEASASSAYGTISVLTAFEKSSNVAFAQLAVNHFLGKEKEYVDRLYNMKLREKLNIELLGEGQAMIRYPSDKLWSKLSLPMMAIGYEELLTPMHTLTFYNAVANNGKMVKPYFIESLQRYGAVEKQFTPQVLSGAICSKSTIDTVKKALRHVVMNGTAKSINDPRYEISGKTGTAQIAFDGVYIDREGYRKHQASFAGFFPSDNPRYTMIVVLYSGKTRGNFYGGTWAAPVFKQIADKIYSASTNWFEPVSPNEQARQVPPQLLAGNESHAKDILSALSQNRFASQQNAGWLPNNPSQDETVPDVAGMGLRDALFILESLGLNVTVSGKGAVRATNPPAGSPLPESQRLQIILEK